MGEAGKELNRPVMVQFSEGGSAFFAGKALPNDKGVLQASILGAVCGAHYVRAVAPAYGIPVFVHSDHCAKKLLPWFDGMLEADKAFFAAHGEPLFSKTTSKHELLLFMQRVILLNSCTDRISVCSSLCLSI